MSCDYMLIMVKRSSSVASRLHQRPQKVVILADFGALILLQSLL